MDEMDIYMRRRLVALGGLVVFFIFFVLLVKSCGGEDEPQPLSGPNTGATGGSGVVTLSEDEFIAEADSICAQANRSVGSLDPADPSAAQDEASITADELAQLESLPFDSPSQPITRFLGALGDVAAALKDKAKAERNADDVAAGEAQLAIDTAEVDARGLGERAGFSDCGQFLDAGEAPGGADPSTGTAPSDGGTVTPPADTGGVTPTQPTTPPATAPPADDGTGGTDGGGGGVSP
jgi:hypothetical protein